MPLVEILKHPDLKITLDGKTYGEMQTIIRTEKNNLISVEKLIVVFANANTLILDSEFPFDFMTENFRISKLVRLKFP